MSLPHIAAGLARQGRGKDTELLHVTPTEVQGLQALAKAHGGSLTRNPSTGLLEAGFLDGILGSLGPAAAPIAGAALSYFTDGWVSPEMAGLGVGALTGLSSGNLGQGLAAGLGAYGGAGLTAGLTSAGGNALAEKAAQGADDPIAAAGTAGDNVSQMDKIAAGANAATNSTAADLWKQYKAPVTALVGSALLGGGVSTQTAMPSASANDPGYIRVMGTDPTTGRMYQKSATPASSFGSQDLASLNYDAPSNFQNKSALQANGTMSNANMYQGFANGGQVKRMATGGSSAGTAAISLDPSAAVAAAAPSGSSTNAVYQYLMGQGANPYINEALPTTTASAPSTVSQSNTTTNPASSPTATANTQSTGGGRSTSPVSTQSMQQAGILGDPNSTMSGSDAYNSALAGMANMSGVQQYSASVLGGPLAGLAALAAPSISDALTAQNNGYGLLSSAAGYSDPHDTAAVANTQAAINTYNKEQSDAQSAQEQSNAAMQAMAAAQAGMAANGYGGGTTGAPGPDGGDPAHMGPNSASGGDASAANGGLMQAMASGGATHGVMQMNGRYMLPGYAEGGPISRSGFFSPQGKDRFHGAQVVAANMAHPAQRGGTGDPALAPTMPSTPFAHGGIASLGVQDGHLGSYSDGGRLLKGPGDGVSDNIPATIGGNTPARLANNEFVIPARIVSELGNGSTDAGAKRLYQMMERIQAGRKKTMGKNSIAVDTHAERHLPA